MVAYWVELIFQNRLSAWYVHFFGIELDLATFEGTVVFLVAAAARVEILESWAAWADRDYLWFPDDPLSSIALRCLADARIE